LPLSSARRYLRFLATKRKDSLFLLLQRATC
jgi:hypothetical protein